MERFGTLDPSTWEPLVNRALISDPQVANLVAAHEREHSEQGINLWGCVYTEAEAHLAALRSAYASGGIPERARSGMGREVCRTLAQLERFYYSRGGDSSFDPTTANKEATLRATWDFETAVKSKGHLAWWHR